MTHLWMMAIGGIAHALAEDVPLKHNRGVGACGRPVHIDLIDDREDPKCPGCVKYLTDLCGTYKGYQRHRRRDEQACQPCLDANAARNRNRRANDSAARVADAALSSARGRAFRRLAREFPDRWRELFAEERAR